MSGVLSCLPVDSLVSLETEIQEQDILFFQDFALYSQKLEEADYAEFSPHYLIYTCRRDPGLEEQCDAMCIRKGRYCVPDPEADLDSGYDGRDIMLVVNEHLHSGVVIMYS